jgi:hypothetical protein
LLNWRQQKYKCINKMFSGDGLWNRCLNFPWPWEKDIIPNWTKPIYPKNENCRTYVFFIFVEIPYCIVIPRFNIYTKFNFQRHAPFILGRVTFILQWAMTLTENYLYFFRDPPLFSVIFFKCFKSINVWQNAEWGLKKCFFLEKETK